MYDLIIEGKKTQALQIRPLIQVSEKQRLIKVQGNVTNITKEDLGKLAEWVEGYKSKNQDILSVYSQNALEFALPKGYSKYTKNYSKYYDSLFNDILADLKYFDLHIQDEKTPSIPSFQGLMTKSFIKFGKEFFSNNTEEYIGPIFSWLDLFLDSKPSLIKVEFWMTYFNTSASLRFLEFFKILEVYKKDNDTKIEILWHWLETDRDSREEGKYYQENTSLDFKVVKVDEKTWNKVND